MFKMKKVSEEMLQSAIDMATRFAHEAFENNVSFFRLVEEWYKGSKSSSPLEWRICVLAACVLRGYRGHANCYWEKFPVTIEQFKIFLPYVYDRVKRKLPLYGVEDFPEFSYGYFRVITLFATDSKYYAAATQNCEPRNLYFDSIANWYKKPVCTSYQKACELSGKCNILPCIFFDLYDKVEEELLT